MKLKNIFKRRRKQPEVNEKKEIIEEIVERVENLPKTIPPKRCLTLSSGGELGKWTLYLIIRLEEDLNFKFYDEFDSFSGSSIGALIAAAIIEKYPLESIFEKTQEATYNIFSKKSSDFQKIRAISKSRPIYDNSKLKQIVHELIGNQLMDSLPDNKTFMVNTISAETQQLKLFSNNLNNDIDTPREQLSDALLGSSSIPIVFEKNLSRNNEELVDAGFIAPDPALESVILDKEFGDRKFELLSLSVPEISKGKYKELTGFKKVMFAFTTLPVIVNHAQTKVLLQRLLGSENCYFSRPKFPEYSKEEAILPENFDKNFSREYYKERELIASFLKHIGVIPKDRQFKYRAGERHRLDQKIDDWIVKINANKEKKKLIKRA